jgi:hypothetical protein
VSALRKLKLQTYLFDFLFCNEVIKLDELEQHSVIMGCA